MYLIGHSKVGCGAAGSVVASQLSIKDKAHKPGSGQALKAFRVQCGFPGRLESTETGGFWPGNKTVFIVNVSHAINQAVTMAKVYSCQWAKHLIWNRCRDLGLWKPFHRSLLFSFLPPFLTVKKVWPLHNLRSFSSGYKEVSCEIVTPRIGCINKTVTTAVLLSMNVLTWKKKFLQGPTPRERTTGNHYCYKGT